jgi:hypothetical protein
MHHFTIDATYPAKVRSKSASRAGFVVMMTVVLFNPCWTAIVLTTLSGLAPSAAAQVKFTKIADTSTIVPGGGNKTFANFHGEKNYPLPLPLALDGTSVAFVGQSGTGVYRWTDGALVVVADQNTPVPYHDAKFELFNHPAISGTSVAFHGETKSPKPLEGIYRKTGDAIVRIADDSVGLLGGYERFSSFGNVGLEGILVCFFSGIDGHAIFIGSDHAGLATIVDKDTLVPRGKGRLETLYSYVVSTSTPDGIQFAFQGSANQQRGIYKYIDGELICAADRTTAVPEGMGTFMEFSKVNLAIDAGNVVFIGTSAAKTSGVYAERGGKIVRIAASGQPRPTGGTFSISFDTNVSADSGAVAFCEIRRAIYLWTEKTKVTKLIGIDDALDGKTVRNVDLGNDSLSGGNVAFWVKFTDDTTGIYLATNAVPKE